VEERCDIAVVGAGAAGLFASIWAGRAAGGGLRIVAMDGARVLGAKILVAGGGRCNVTHHEVTERDYAGSTPPAIRRVLRAFGVAETVRFFAECGVDLKREDTGKLFPVSDRARTVLDALLRAAADVGVDIRHPARVEGVRPADGGFHVEGAWGRLAARRVILGAGGRAGRRCGSDGSGEALATALGHSIAQPVVPALVPLVLDGAHWIRGLSGLALPVELTLRAPGGRRLMSTRGSALCTHFGLSGPAVLDISRHWLVARRAEPGATLEVNWVPGCTPETFDRDLRAQPGTHALAALRARVPERLARALCDAVALVPTTSIQQIPRETRRRLVETATACVLPVVGDRGYSHAEATAGGVPLAELRLDTMESRICPGLHVAGEVCDVDGRIGGFNFQWAWASGVLAGQGAARHCMENAAT
jgi:predicted Rossmann fold flavoprotein